MDWNEETIVKLRALWSEGHSTAEIGRRMGVSKNAVVGKAHRLNLSSRPSPIRRDGIGAANRQPTPRRIVGPTLPSMAEPMSPVMARVPRPAVVRVAPGPGNGPSVTGVAPDSVVGGANPAEPSVPTAMIHEIQPAKPVPVAVAAASRPRRTIACCWPIGEPGTKSFRFCDDASAPGKPYCTEHAALAYVKVRDRREDAA